MSDESIEDLLTDLPPRLRARRDELEALLEGRLPGAARAALEREAESDEELGYALMLFTPFDAAEMDGVKDKLTEALPQTPARPKLEVLPGGAPDEPAPSAIPARSRWAVRGPLVVGGMLAAAAVVVLSLIPPPPSAPYEVVGPTAAAFAPEQAVRLELKPHRDGLQNREVTVLAVAGSSVHRAQLPLRTEGDTVVLEAPAKDLVGPLAGVVQLLVLSGTDTDPQGRVQADDVRNMIETLASDRASTQVIVQPPAYAMVVEAVGTMRGAAVAHVDTASTAVDVPGRVSFNLKPETKALGALAVHAFVVRDRAAAAPLTMSVQAKDGAFLVEGPTAEVMGDADLATLYFLVGPKGEAPPAVDTPPSAPWRRRVHRLYRKSP